jgi:predicted ATPase
MCGNRGSKGADEMGGVFVTVRIFARNFRGFRDLDFTLDGVTFLVGDNSSGKSSIIHLINYVVSSELNTSPSLPDGGNSVRYDFFSPYFDFSDVTIGFHSLQEKRSVTKVITMRQRSDLMTPIVLRYTCIIDGKRVTLKKRGEKIWIKTSTVSEDADPKKIYELHDENSGFIVVNNADNEREGASINSPDVIYGVVFVNVISKDFNEVLLRSVSVTIPSSASHMGPLRGLPEPYYALERIYSPKGSHFAAMWHDIKKIKEEKYSDLVRKFGIDSQLFEDLEVEKLSRKIAHSPLVVTVRKRGKNFTLSQVGVGISQVVPVIVESIFRKATDDHVLMLLQQPELHLHPIAQAALGEFIFEMSDDMMWFAIETHSDYLMDRFRYNLRTSDRRLSAQIIFCQNRDDGNYASCIPIRSDGELGEAPDGYREFQVNELMRTMF